jgi:hypothetical protein
MACAVPAPSSATTLHDPTDANAWFCSFRCQKIYLDIHRHTEPRTVDDSMRPMAAWTLLSQSCGWTVKEWRTA